MYLLDDIKQLTQQVLISEKIAFGLPQFATFFLAAVTSFKLCEEKFYIGGHQVAKPRCDPMCLKERNGWLQATLERTSAVGAGRWW